MIKTQFRRACVEKMTKGDSGWTGVKERSVSPSVGLISLNNQPSQSCFMILVRELVDVLHILT